MAATETPGEQRRDGLPASVHEVVLERSGTGVVVFDRELRYTAANAVAARTNGMSVEEHIGRTLHDVIPDVAHEFEPVLRQVFRTGQAVTDLEVVGSAESAPGHQRFWNVSVVPVPGGEERVAAVFMDVTAQRRADQRLRNVMNSLFAFVGLLDTAGRVLEANDAALEAAGLSPDEVVGRRFWETPWWAWNEGVQRRLREAVERAARGEPSRYDELVQLRGGRLTPIDFQLAPMFDGDRVVGLVPSGIDIRSRVEATTRLEALAHLSGTLAGCTTSDEALDATVRHPASIEDATHITVLIDDGDGVLRHQGTGTGLAEIRPGDEPVDADLGLALRCLHEGAPTPPGEEARTPVQALELTDGAGRRIGALVIRWEDPPELDPAARARIALVADLCSQALVRAARVDELDQLVDAVGRQALTQSVDRPRLDVAIRYDPSTEVARFGGDWFDLVELSDSRTAVVLGDVAGHGARAAGTMAQVKGLLRGLVLAAEPTQVFELATRGIAGPHPEMVATAALAVIDTAAGTLQTVLAGHPPPMLRTESGSVRHVEAHTRPPVGVPAERKPPAADGADPGLATAFTPGSTLVLYSDGLVESRRRQLHEGIAELEAALAEVPRDATAAETADRVLAALAAGESEDDVALVVVRFRPEP